MKAIALALLVSVPSLAWGQVTNPAYPQSNPSADAPVAVSLVPRAEAVPAVESTPVPVYQRWYFWTGVGVAITGIIAASVAVAVLSSSNRGPTPSQVCGGVRCDACVGASCSTP